ncbi:hypothetical protein EC919_102448 [Pseudomonas graminis]|nr:hypothetical protein EC919_102448 [Pseudomonas graminis]
MILVEIRSEYGTQLSLNVAGQESSIGVGPFT